MKMVRVSFEFDDRRILGAFQFNPADLPPGNDWVLAPSLRRFNTASGVRYEVTGLGLIDVRKHPLFPRPRSSRLLTFLRRLVPRLTRTAD